MIVGFVIEDNFIKTSFIDKDGKPAILKQSAHRDEYELTLIMEDNFSYTTKTLENVKLANPKLVVFDHILTKPDQEFKTVKGAVWNNRQLMAILFKKMVHDLNSSSIQQLTEAYISLPPNSEEHLLEDITKSLKANGVLETKHIEYQSACKQFNKVVGNDVAVPVFINLSEELITVLGDFDEAVEGYSGLNEVLMNQIVKENKSDLGDSKHFDLIELYLINSELKKIKSNILNNTVRKEYHILLRDDYMILTTPLEAVNTFLMDAMLRVKDLVQKLKLNSIVFTGRYVKYPAIQDTIDKVFSENNDLSYEVDKFNEIKSKGILFN